MSKKTIVTLFALIPILIVSAIPVALPNLASESSGTRTLSTAEPQIEMAELQQQIYDQGYNYTVTENWISALSPEERARLCGYKPPTPSTSTTGQLPGNIRFRSMVERSKSGMVGRTLGAALPTSYDAMALGNVTPVKNQGYCGSCWIFAATADFESDVLINENQTFDFSEQEVGDCNIWASVGGHNFCEGGNAFMTTNYFTKYGAADEACHPYNAISETCQNCPLLRNVNNWRIITGSDGESQINTIKNAILNYGPVYSTIYANGAFMAYDSEVYEYSGSEEPNHAIQIIGWNDSPGTNGAWLIKNSWGTGWGAGGPYPGCAWVAYGAANLGDYTSAIAGYKNPGDVIFYHDECGWMEYCAGCNATTAYGAVRFTPVQNSSLTAVDFWAVDPEMQYEIAVFDTISGSSPYYTFSDQLGTTQTGSTTEKGYYSIPLTTPIQLVSGDDFIVQVNFTTTTGWEYPVPIDYCDDPDLNWSAIANSSGESYMSCNGTGFDKYGVDGVDVGIRARAEVPNEPPTASIDSIAPDPAEQAVDTVSFIGHGTDVDGTVIGYSWRSSIDGLLNTSESFTKPALELSVGMHTIYFKVRDDNGAWSTEATKNLTISPHEVVDTGAGGYPSIFGMHNGTITPNKTINVSKMYTYPCTGTGGHSEYVRIGNVTWNATATWTGYSGDWHNITFDSPFVLEAGKTYNYEITTGSYPQIHHTDALSTANGWINCSKFTDANGKEYNNWIPAIRLK